MFEKVTKDERSNWQRKLAEEGTFVTASFDSDGMVLSLSPTISSYPQHENHRLCAAVMFEIAAKYAEKVDGKIFHLSNVGECARESEARNGEPIAHYPNDPLQWVKVCIGFRELFLPV